MPRPYEIDWSELAPLIVGAAVRYAGDEIAAEVGEWLSKAPAAARHLLCSIPRAAYDSQWDPKVNPPA